MDMQDQAYWDEQRRLYDAAIRADNERIADLHRRAGYRSDLGPILMLIGIGIIMAAPAIGMMIGMWFAFGPLGAHPH